MAKEFSIKRMEGLKRMRQPIEMKSIEEIEFDEDSYPIWVNPFNFAYTRFGADRIFLYTPYTLIPTPAFMVSAPIVRVDGVPVEGRDSHYIYLDLGLPPKTEIHGAVLYYEVSNSRSYIRRVDLKEFNPDTTQRNSLHEAIFSDAEVLNSEEKSKYQFLVHNHQRNGHVTLILTLHLERTEQMSDFVKIYGVKVMVKDISA